MTSLAALLLFGYGRGLAGLRFGFFIHRASLRSCWASRSFCAAMLMNSRRMKSLSASRAHVCKSLSMQRLSQWSNWGFNRG